MDLIKSIWSKVSDLQKTVVLPESQDERIVLAADKITQISNLKVILLGKKDDVFNIVKEKNCKLEDVEILDHLSSDKREEFANAFFEKRKHKGISLDDAKKEMENPLNFAAMLVNKGVADGCVAGAINATGNVIKAGLYNIGTAEGSKTISSCFMMVLPDKSFGEQGIISFADCAVVPDPTAAQLADIAIATAKTFRSLVQKEPKVAMLSFSTKGSAKHPQVDEVVEALGIVKEKAPELDIDGELQADSAIIPSVAKKKVKGESSVAGQANVLIFPDLNSGNIGYKLVQRLAKAQAYGPLFQGLKKPINDLSRGCSVDDIVNVAAITVAQSL